MKRILILGILLSLGMSLNAQLHYTNEDLPCVNKTFKVHFHLIRNSSGEVPVDYEQLEEACEVASEKFAPICMKFEICQIDTIINYNFDSLALEREYIELGDKYAHKNRINVFIMDTTFVENGETEAQICGLGGEHVWLSCLPAFTHELGHFFGLLHTFEGSGEELVDGSNCETHGDKICDTPADPHIQHTQPMVNANCEFIGRQLDANGQYYIPHTGNVMSYYGCPCQEFSSGQFLKMIETYNGKYKNLW